MSITKTKMNFQQDDQKSNKNTTISIFSFGTRKRGEGKGEQEERKNTRWNGMMKKYGFGRDLEYGG